jgi:hypothetical protein
MANGLEKPIEKQLTSDKEMNCLSSFGRPNLIAFGSSISAEKSSRMPNSRKDI